MSKQKKPTRSTPGRLWAFWAYSSFPYVLGSEIAAVLDSGLVKVIGYGGGTFRPIAIFPYHVGYCINNSLQTLDKQHNAASQLFDAEWRAKVAALGFDVSP